MAFTEWSNSYEAVIQAAANYYGGVGNSQFDALVTAIYNHDAVTQAQILKQVPFVDSVVNANGELISASVIGEATTYSASQATTAAIAQSVNSNAVTAASQTATINATLNAVKAEGATTATITQGASKVATETPLKTALGHAATWLLGAGVGLKLGVWLDAGLYKLTQHTPWTWDDMPYEYNPENWNDYKVTSWLYDNSGYDEFIGLFDTEGKQLYVDENLFALAAQYMYNKGMFTADGVENDVPVSYYGDPSTVPDDMIIFKNIGIDLQLYGPEYRTLKVKEGNNVKMAYCDCLTNNTFLFVSNDPFIIASYSSSTGEFIQDIAAGTEVTIDGHTFYRASFVDSTSLVLNIPKQVFPGAHWNDLLTLMQFGTETEGMPGVNVYDTTPDLEGLTDLSDILAALKEQYPELWAEKIKQGVLNDDGTVTDHIYVPIGLPTGGEEGQPTTDPDHPGAVDPTNETMLKTIVQLLQNNPTPQKDPTNPDIGEGNTPTVTVPTGTASALFKIYNPTESEIASFGSWLWSPNFVDQLLKMFNDPMQAIISLHKIYATPHIGGRSNIRVGYLDSGVASNYVDQQYIDIDCGSVMVSEKAASVLDYAPFVDIRLYLPFVGIVALDVADVMRGRVGVKYRVDVLTGTLIATVSITRDAGAGGVIYQYTGSCAETFPLSSGSFMGIITGVLGIAAGVVGTIATGGAAAPALLGGAAGLTAMHTKVEHSNGFSGNAGALGCKKPYLIISRSQSALSDGIGENSGWPANSLVKLTSCSGYTRIKAIHLAGIDGATDTELTEIEALLKGGVII